MPELTPHPRLFAHPQDFGAIDGRFDSADPVASCVRELYHSEVATAAAEVALPDPDVTAHNWHLIRMRQLQQRIVTMLVEYRRTGDARYRELAWQYVKLPAGWDYWSWIDWRGPEDPPTDSYYDLSFGEIGMTLALAYDWLYDELTDEERDLIITMARRQTTAYLRSIAEGVAGWRDKEYSNWTAVCNGGAGMLALALWEELDNSAEVLEHAEYGITAFFESLHDDGGWPEGLGYWNYGMRYGFLYLLSHEAATATSHPLMARTGVGNTALFPLLFCPNGQASGFGDSNNFRVFAFHYRLLERLGLQGYVPMLDAIAAREGGFGGGSWPEATLYGLLGPTARDEDTEAIDVPPNKLLGGIKWGYLSDALPNPQTCMTIRGGSLQVPHRHVDLMAFWLVVGDEAMLVNASDGSYIDTTFSGFRFELYGCGPLSKNTILLDGVGVRPDSISQTRSFEHNGCFAIQLDTSDCFGGEYYRGASVEHCSRTFVNLGEQRYLIVDRARFATHGQFEARFHTFLPTDIGAEQQTVAITGKESTVKLRFACTQPVALRQALSTPVVATQPADTILQVQSQELIEAITLVTLIDLAEHDERLRVNEQDDLLAIELGGEALGEIPLDGNADPFGHR